MKKHILLVILTFFLMVISCEKEEDPISYEPLPNEGY